MFVENGFEAATATADAYGVAAFNLTSVATGTHNYALFDATTHAQITLAQGDYTTRAATLSVIVA